MGGFGGPYKANFTSCSAANVGKRRFSADPAHQATIDDAKATSPEMAENRVLRAAMSGLLYIVCIGAAARPVQTHDAADMTGNGCFPWFSADRNKRKRGFSNRGSANFDVRVTPQSKKIGAEPLN